MAQTLYEAIKQANLDYHKACERVFQEGIDFIPDVDERAAFKAEFGGHAANVFAAFKRIEAIVKPYYP